MVGLVRGLTTRPRRRPAPLGGIAIVGGVLALALSVQAQQAPQSRAMIGREHGVARHLEDDEEFTLPLVRLIEHGRQIFAANWTEQDGAGRPLMKGTGKELADPRQPLTGIRSFNRISGPDANGCAGCHNQPFGMVGGGGDFVTNVFVMAQRFDFVSFGAGDGLDTGADIDEARQPVSLATVGNSRSSPGMFGAGYLEMLAREITAELHVIRDGMQLGESRRLVAKGISFGTLTRRADGMWDTSKVEGLGRLSLLAPMPIDRPTLIVRLWHQASHVVSLREFTNTSFNHHHGMQSTERFGRDTDPDGDGVMNELTRADITAASVFQATLPVPGRVIPRDPEVEAAIGLGERTFARLGCTHCHVPELPLSRANWIYTEPNPYNPPSNLRVGDAPTLRVDLTHPDLPQPRLRPSADAPDVVMVPAYTDFKLHDITDPDDPEAAEPIDQNQSLVSAKLRGGNRRFVTRRLWGVANEPPYFHHGRFTTLRQAVLAHHGEALGVRRAFEKLAPATQDAVIEFLKSLQVLPPGTLSTVVDEQGHPRDWNPRQPTGTSP